MRTYMALITNDTEGHGEYVRIRAYGRRGALRLAARYAMRISRMSTMVRNPDVWCEELRLVPRRLEWMLTAACPRGKRNTSPFYSSTIIYSIHNSPWHWADTGAEIPQRRVTAYTGISETVH